ncbi:hypothetical protein BGX33_009525 [Mortierella sp. NVP41]|nr:hypothetical protein BGX33_009525 [Mortierella sp. NVP41]
MRPISTEVLSRIGYCLRSRQILTCMLVCRQWNEAFTPCLWRLVQLRHSVFGLVLYSNHLHPELPTDEQEEEEHGRISALMQKYGRHIRELVVGDNDRVLRAAFETELAGLVALSAVYDWPEQRAHATLDLCNFHEITGGSIWEERIP